ncbi:MAG TPA: hypothetical protein VHQ47_18030 [Phycisphaerae bacterium]|nr:hypothetical protein [Phycisphaerae bacterium]
MAKKRKPAGSRPDPLSEAPTCSCLLLCDDVVISTAQDKHVLQGVIGSFGLPAVPAVAGNFVAYLRVSNVYPSQKLSVRFENASSGEVLFEFEAQFVSQKDPLEVHTLVSRIYPFEVKEFGRHILSAVYNGMPVAQTPVYVVEMSE